MIDVSWDRLAVSGRSDNEETKNSKRIRTNTTSCNCNSIIAGEKKNSRIIVLDYI